MIIRLKRKEAIKVMKKMQTLFGERFIIDKNGRQKAVVIEIKQYQKIKHLLEEAQVIKLIKKGEKEYTLGKTKHIKSLAELE